MKIFRDITEISEEYQNAVIVLGNFDGFHLGHRSIIDEAKAIATVKKLPLALMTFEPHPREFLAKEKTAEGLRIYNLRSKLFQIKSLGIESIFLVRFNEQFANLSADEFIKNILVDKLQVRHVITGENFYFGKNRQGDKNLLASYAENYGFKYLPCSNIRDENDTIISSSLVRELLKNGQVTRVAKLLGQPYHIISRVIHGEGRGHKLGFPTANISLKKLFIPRYGVYAVRARVDGEDKIYNAVANLGIKPTFGINAPLLEVHLFDVQLNLYGKKLCVEFVEFIRGEKKFLSLNDLKAQIVVDCAKAKSLLRHLVK